MIAIEKTISRTILNRIRARRAESSASNGELRTPGPVAPAKIREARFSDFPAVAELKQRGGLNPDSLENWERLWRRNPVLQGQ